MKLALALALATASSVGSRFASAQYLQAADAGAIGMAGGVGAPITGLGAFNAPVSQTGSSGSESSPAGEEEDSGSGSRFMTGFQRELPDPRDSEEVSTGGGSDLPGCYNDLVRVLARAGFSGGNLREAWAIAMRESGGQADLGPGNPRFNGADWGLFQFNKPTWGRQSWWNDSKMRDADYNAKVAFKISKGGSYWLPWGLTGDGRPNGALYRNAGWTEQQVQERIVAPFEKYYARFAALPAACKS